MRILVIGGTRFIGPPVVQRLHAEGHSLALFHRRPAEVDLPPGIDHILGERRAHLADFSEDFRRFEPDVVLDMIPITEQDARMLMGTFKGMAWRIVAISSVDVYRAYGRLIGTEPGPPDPMPLTEDSPLRERLYPYRGETPRAADDPAYWMDDYDKILVEQTVMSDPQLPGTVLRLPMVYGPSDYQHRLHPYLKRMDDGRRAILLDERSARWRGSHGYVENVAAAIALAVRDERAAGRIYNVAEAATPTEAEWVRAVGRAAGWPGEVIVVPNDLLPEQMRETRPLDQDLVADTTRLRAELGFAESVPYEEGLRRAVAWERENPPPQVNPADFDYAAEDAVLAKIERA